MPHKLVFVKSNKMRKILKIISGGAMGFNMQRIPAFISLIVLFISFISCRKDDPVIYFNKDFDTLSVHKFYNAEIFSTKYDPIYGKWKVIGTSGGFWGRGYTSDFDMLILKPVGIFGITRNDSLIFYGKILIKSQTESHLLIEFMPEDFYDIPVIELMADPEKYISIRHDTLNLYSPCCDRFNTHLKRLK
jgi:hypothetical protein